MYKFYQVSHNNGRDAKIILASTKYEAIGFYLSEEAIHIEFNSLDKIQILPPNYKVYGYNKTIEEIWKEKDDWISPKTIVTLVNF